MNRNIQFKNETTILYRKSYKQTANCISISNNNGTFSYMIILNKCDKMNISNLMTGHKISPYHFPFFCYTYILPLVKKNLLNTEHCCVHLVHCMSRRQLQSWLKKKFMLGRLKQGNFGKNI